MARLILINKPFHVLSQFRDSGGRATLADYIDDPRLRVAGRLDYDSEGLLLLTDDGQLLQQITHPKRKMWKTYWVQVEGQASDAALQALRRGLNLKDGLTKAARASILPEEPALWPRDPPVRMRAQIPTQWLEISIREGRNRQVRRMTAAAGLPTLRLVRARIGDWELAGLQPGKTLELQVNMPRPSRSGRALPRSGR